MFQKIIEKLRLVVGRCVIKAVRYGDDGPVADLELTAGEKRRGVAFLQQYGLISRPKGLVSGLALFVGGDRANGAVVACNGEESAMQKQLKEGEVCLLAPFGQQIYLKEDGSISLVSANGVIDADGELHVTKDVVSYYGTPAQVGLSTHQHGTALGNSTPSLPGT